MRTLIPVYESPGPSSRKRGNRSQRSKIEFRIDMRQTEYNGGCILQRQVDDLCNNVPPDCRCLWPSKMGSVVRGRGVQSHTNKTAESVGRPEIATPDVSIVIAIDAKRSRAIHLV